VPQRFSRVFPQTLRFSPRRNATDESTYEAKCRAEAGRHEARLLGSLVMRWERALLCWVFAESIACSAGDGGKPAKPDRRLRQSDDWNASVAARANMNVSVHGQHLSAMNEGFAGLRGRAPNATRVKRAPAMPRPDNKTSRSWQSDKRFRAAGVAPTSA
jgi:hypothetical protein